MECAFGLAKDLELGRKPAESDTCLHVPIRRLAPKIREVYMARFWICLALFLFIATPLASQQTKTEGDWSPLSFLIGDWIGEGGGGPGQGTGSFSFHPELRGKILVRKNHSEYAATKDRPAFSHDDLLYVCRETPGNRIRAIYFDTEGHVIRYSMEPSGDGSTIQFLSDASPSVPHYRLTYTKTAGDTVAIKFEIAPSEKPESYSTYIEAKARRKESR